MKPFPTDYDTMEDGTWARDIQPILNSLKAQCEMDHIPFAVSFAVANKDGKTQYFHDGVLPDSRGSGLYQNNFGKYLLALQGAYVSPYDASHNMADVLRAYEEQSDEEE